MKAMALTEEMKDILNIVSSYEIKIQSTSDMFDTTHQLLQGFRESFLDTRGEREKISAQLRENLAQTGSLRRKDFDWMMQGILSTQDEKEKEVKDLLRTYLDDQKEMANALRESLGKFKDSLDRGEVQRVKDSQGLIKEILAKQDRRKNEVISRLKDFQKEQQEMTTRLKELLAKGRELRIRDLKTMLKEFEIQRQERIARQEERRKEVRKMLGDFKKERWETARNFRPGQKKRTQRRTGSPEAVELLKKHQPDAGEAIPKVFINPRVTRDTISFLTGLI
ncbi:MAG: hypothetical protein AB1797_06900 [bacterium]